MAFPADNVLGNYTVEFYARTALRALKSKKGIARLVNRQAEIERQSSWEQGDKVKLRRPGNFTASEHTQGTADDIQGLHGQNVQITLDKYPVVNFGATDFQRATSPRAMMEHISRAMDAIVTKIEGYIYALGSKVGPVTDISGASGAEDQIVDPLQTLIENNAPVDDGQIFYAVDPSLAALFKKDPIFHQARMAGENEALATLLRGVLGTRFGVNIFESQLAKRLIAQQTATLAAAAGSGDRVGAANADYDVNISQVVIKALTDTQTVSTDVDTVTFAGDPTVYRVTAVGGAVSSNLITATLFPALRQPLAEDTVATFGLRKAIQDAAAGTIENLMFHRDAIALVMAPLPMDGNGAGAEQFTAVDEETGLSIRVTRGYDVLKKQMVLSFDALCGVEVLDGQLATRVIRAQS